MGRMKIWRKRDLLRWYFILVKGRDDGGIDPGGVSRNVGKLIK